jgi:hypothetical protein
MLSSTISFNRRNVYATKIMIHSLIKGQIQETIPSPRSRLICGVTSDLTTDLIIDMIIDLPTDPIPYPITGLITDLITDVTGDFKFNMIKFSHQQFP